MLAIFGRPPEPGPWLRVVGLVVLVLALYYLAAARTGLTAFFRFTVWGRPFAALILLALTVVQVTPPFVLILAGIDVAAAVWTARALRAGAPGPDGS